MIKHTKYKVQLDKDLIKAERIHRISRFETFLKELSYEEMSKFTDIQLFELFLYHEDIRFQKPEQEQYKSE